MGQAGSSSGNKKLTERQEIQQDNMQGLLARFMVEKGYTAAEISTKLNSKEFEQYILGQGFDPETFQYIPLHERAHAYSKYNSERDSQLNLSEEQLQHAISAMTDYMRWEDIRE